MKLNPQQAPLYGECVLTVQLNNDDLSHAEGKEPEEEVEFYLLFSGSTQRHVTSTLRVSRVTLQAVCPAHNVCEQVLVTLCWARPGRPVDTHSQETFCFIQDLALDMASFLLDSTAPQEALLLDDKQIPLKECKKLDESLALALKHLSLPHHRTARTYTQADVGSRMNHQTHAITATDAHTHSDTQGCSAETQKEPLSILLDSCSAVQRGHHLSSLLHLAASHGLRMVAMFLLQQDGSLEALRRTNAQGQTAADVAESRGHKHLVELFTQHEETGDIQLKPKEQLHFYPEGKVFQRHADLGTYTLTLLGQRQREGGADSREDHRLQEEVEELRRLIQIHRDAKGKSNSAGNKEVSPVCGLQLCSNEQQESRQDAGLALVTTTTDEQGSPLSLEDQTQGEDPAVVTRASCASALLCQSQEARGGRRGATAVNPPAAQNRKNKKRNAKTTRRATESAGKRNTQKTSRGTAQGETETTGSGPEREAPAEAFVWVGDGGNKKSQQSSRAEETPFPIKPVSPPGEVGTYVGKQVVALPTPSIAEKQEREEWEVEVLICGLATERETVTVSPPARQEPFTSPVEFCLPHHTIVAMGQEQSQSSQETQTDQEEPDQAVFSPRCPDTEQKHKLLWQDGAWTGSQEGSPSHEREGLAKTVWFQSGNLELGASEDSNRKEVNSRSIWYYSDKMEEEKHEQIKVAECDLNTPQACGLTSPQLLEHGLSSCQLCTALSQPHAVGAQPAPSHGPAAQRREVHESQPEKEVGPDWKEEGVEGGKEEVSKTVTTYSRKSSETTDIEEREDEKPKSEEKGGKGRKKRRQKKGRRGGGKPKLSSSSSLESKSQSESQREQATGLSLQLESEAKDQTLRSHIQFTAAPEPASREDAVEDFMQLPRQTEDTRDTAGPVCDPPHSQSSSTSPIDHGKRDLIEVTSSQTLRTNDSSDDENTTVCGQDGFNPDSAATASGLDQMDIIKVDGEEIMTMQLFGKEVFDRSQLQSKMTASLVPQTMANGGSGELSIVDKASVNQTGLLESKHPEELFSDSKETREHLCLVVSSEQNIQQVQSLDLNKPKQISAETEAVSLPCEGTALQIQEGRTEATEARGYLMHNGMLTDQQCKEENRHDLLVGGVEESKNTDWKRKSEENDCGIVHGNESSSIVQRKMVEDEHFPSLDVEKTLNHDRNLVATAVAVVTVAIASAMVSIELNQQSASKDVRNDLPLAQDANISTDTCRRLTEHLSSITQSTQLTSKDRLSAVSPTDTLTEETHSVELGYESETEKLRAEQLCLREQADVSLSNTPSLQELPKETSNATAQNKHALCSVPEEETGGFYAEPVPEANESVTASTDSQPHVLTESQLPCPVMDTGQDPMDNDQCTFLCLTESASPLLSSQLQEKELQGGDGSLHVECPTDWCEGGEQRHISLEKTEGSEGTMDMSDSNCRTEEHESEPQVLKTTLEEESRTSTLPVVLCDPTPVADSGPGELTFPVTLETSEYQSSQSEVDMNPAVAMVESKDHGSVVVADMDALSDKDHMDAVDGWKERERNKLKREQEAENTVTVKDTSVTEAESFLVAQEENEQTSRDLDCTHTLQIERKRDVFYPVQPCPQQRPVAAYADIHPDREDSLPVCLLHSDDDRQKGSTKLDDGVFKRPDPPPCVERGGRGVSNSVSSAEDALKLGTPSHSEGIWSVGAPHSVDTQSCRLSLQSETEDQGRDKEMGGGEEEEKKDQLPESPVASAILRGSIRSMSPFRRHSWEPVRNNTAAEITRRRSFNSLLGELKRPKLHRRSVSWCPSNLHHPHQEQTESRSYSLEGLEVQRAGFQTQCPRLSDQEERTAGRSLHLDSHERGSLVSLTEEEQEGDGSSIDSQKSHQVLSVTTSCPAMFHQNHQNLTKSISMVPISHYDIEESGSFSSTSGSVDCSITEEDPGPLRSDTEGKGGPKIRRTFSYIRSKMIKKGKDKEKERRGEKEQESKEREKKSASGHLFVPVSPPLSTACQHCTKPLHNKDTFHCNNCGLHVHKSCRESVSVCAKSKAKQPQVPDVSPGSAGNVRNKSTSSASSISSSSSSSSRERWSTATSPDDQIALMFPRRHPSIFNPHSNLSKSISTSNIAGLDEVPLKGLKFLSQSTEALHPGNKVNASTESLPDEGCPITHVHTNDTEVVDNQLMEEFECDVKDLEADSWSSTVDKKFLKTLKKDEIKRQDVIYELYQTEFHHVRTLKIMSEVYSKGLQKEVQLETETLEKIFPVLDDLLHIHTEFLLKLLETKRASSGQGQNRNTTLICHIGDILVNQFSDSSANRMKKAYGRFCSRHHEAVNLYKDLHAKDKRFQAFIKKTMSSSIVRRLSIPECILLVTQRITKYPVLIQRILQHTKDSHADHSDVCESLRCVKELISAVDSKVNEHDKKRRLREVHSRTDSKSIMRMKSGQMFAKEDLIRGRKLLHDGAVQLKNSAGRLKDVQAMLLSDVLVFLQEKDQKYVFASLDQRSTVISLQNLIVREVANEERGLFLITAGTDRPEMVEVLASSKEERNIWMAIIQDAMHCMEKDDDDGVPSETEEDRKQQENRAKEIRELLRRKDEQIVSLLEEKVLIFRDLSTCNPAPEDTNPPVRQRMLFRATPDYVTKGEPIIKDALTELENLRDLVDTGVSGAGCSVPPGLTGGSVGPVCLPRRAETFGGFDSHQMNSSKNGEKEEADESLDLRRTESDSVLKKGATASLQMLLKRNNGQLHDSVTYLHNLLVSLQAVVVQQDSFVEDQRQALEDRLSTVSSKHSSSSSLSSLSSSRPSSLIEQEKHRSLEIQRQEAASLQKQQASHQEEKRRKEKEWELKEKCLAEREKRLLEEEEETRRRNQELLEEREMLKRRKEEYQREMGWLREAQRRLERDEEVLRRDTEKLEAVRKDKLEMFQKFQRTSSTNSEDSKRCHSSESLDLDLKDASDEPKEVELSSSAPTKEPFLRIGSKRMGKNFNPFSLSSSSKAQGAEKSQDSQLSTKLLQLAKPKEKKDKKKKGKKEEQTQMENKVTMMSDPPNDEDIFFC
ncbi:A-kinase anchor protein 13 isoform X2 [Solea solea]|uniref:A-kinase anchor protein 13 isoform X2 n=1 Tax=Solea solea TaxID=90069 RepID=UPI00272D77F5|nr:A-kinase anchor protein 13 isoform X2 [Solea solea]